MLNTKNDVCVLGFRSLRKNGFNGFDRYVSVHKFTNCNMESKVRFKIFDL